MGGKTVAQWDQDSFAWYADTGGEGTGQIGSTNNNPSGLVSAVQYRLRYLIQETAGSNQAETPSFELEYRVDPAGGTSFGSWLPIDSDDSYFTAVSSANVTDGGSTTQQIGGGTFRDGEFSYVDATAWAPTNNLTATQGNDEYECEWVMNFAAGGNFEFRVTRDGGNTMDSTTRTTQVLITAPSTETITTSLSAYRKALGQTSTTSLSSYLRQEDNTQTATLTAYLQDLVELTADLDAYLKAFGQTADTSLTSYLQQTAELTTSLTAHLSAGGTETLTTALDAYLKATGQTQTTTLSAYLQQLKTLTTTLTAYLKATDQQRQTSLTAHLIAAGAVLLTTGLDAYLKATGQQQTTALGGYLRQTGNLITSALSAFLGLTSGLAASVTAYLKALGVEVAASLSATLQAASGSTVGLGYLDLTAQCESAAVAVSSSSATVTEFGGTDD